MKNLIYLIMLLATASSCIPKYYGLANYATESSYVPKPIYQDTTVVANYLTGSYYVSPSTYEGVFSDSSSPSKFGNLEWIRSTVKERIFYAFGVNGYGGLIHTREILDTSSKVIIIEGDKNYYGGGVTVAFGTHFSSPKWQTNLGIKVSGLYEKGSYSGFRKTFNSVYDYKPNPNVTIKAYQSNLAPNDFSGNISLTIDCKRVLDADSSIGIHGALGGGNQKVTIGGGLVYAYKKATFVLSGNRSLFGVTYFGTSLSYQINSRLKK